MSTGGPTLTFYGVISESRRIINAHSRHFLALSVLFLLPLSFSLFIYPTLQSTLSDSSDDHSIRTLLDATAAHTHTSDHLIKTLAFRLIYTLFVFVFSLCAVATITYSTYHGFYGRPVKLVSAINSLFKSFMPLLSTSIVTILLISLICIGFGVFIGLVTKGVEFLGFEINYRSNYFSGFFVIVMIILAIVLVYVKVNWALATVIVVVESNWGFDPLRRSKYLVKGMRWVSLSILLFFGVIIVWINLGLGVADLGGVSGGGWKSWAFIAKIVLGSSFVTLFMLHNLAAITVLYMYCKAVHGELALEIVEEFAREYVSLPFDDEKVPHVVYIAQA